jgi:uncharacterized membrane-anchored protein
MNDLQQQLQTARAVLAVLERQAAGYTVLTIPAHLKIELDAKREQVAALEARLAAPQTGSASVPLPDRATLHRKISGHFTVDEMRQLCFGLGIEHENLSDRRSTMAMEIVEYCERYVMTDQLVAACRRMRPQVSW